MRRILAEFKAFMKIWTRSRSTLFFTFAFPVIFILVFGWIFGQTGTAKFDLHVQNLDVTDGTPTQLSETFVDLLNKTGALNIIEVSRDVNVTNYIKEKGLTKLLIVPNGFENRTIAGNSTVILKMVPAVTDPSSASVAGIVQSVIKGFNSVLTGTKDPITVQPESIATKLFKYVDFFVPGVIGMTIVTTSLFGAITSNTKYRELGILKKLAVTPLSKLEWILGVVIYHVFLSFLSTAVIIMVGVAVFNVKAIPDVYAVILMVSGAVAFTGIGMLIAHFVKEAEAADAAANVVFFPQMFLSGTFFPIEFMPDFLQPIAKVLPLTYLNNGLRDAMIYGNITSALTNSLIILAVAAFFIIVASLLTTWREE